MNDNEIIFVFIGIIALICVCIPGIIASHRNHAYKYIIWALSIIGVVNGVTWIIAFFWAIWPQEKSLADPFIGNVTGTGTRNVGDSLGSAMAGYTIAQESESLLRKRLQETDELLSQGLINDFEHKKKRSQILMA